MPTTVTEQAMDQESVEAVELPELTSSQLVFEHGAQYEPVVCPSASVRAA